MKLVLTEGFRGSVGYNPETKVFSIDTPIQYQYRIEEKYSMKSICFFRFEGDNLLMLRVSVQDYSKNDAPYLLASKAEIIVGSETRKLVGEKLWKRFLANPSLVPTIDIDDNCSTLEERDVYHYGVYLNNKYMDEKEVDSEERFYSFRFGVASFSSTERFSRKLVNKLDLPGEYTGNMQDFVSRKVNEFLEKEHVIIRWKRKELIQAAGLNEELNELIRRLYRLSLPVEQLPLPTLREDHGYAEYYALPTEYLPVDKETSFYGNYEVDSEQCCRVSISYTKKYDKSPLEQVKGVLATRQSSGDFAQEEKDLIKLLRSVLDEETRPYCIHLSGNDDDSWSKTFWTLEEVWKEYMYLLQLEPINKQRDIHSRGYYFSN